jgi:hypothetical protein
VLLPTRVFGFAFLLWAPFAAAQSNLGELLDAGAKMMSPEEFKQEVVGRVITGPTSTGGTLEVIYAGNGSVQGRGSYAKALFLGPLDGEWMIDDGGRVCTGMRIGGSPSTPGVMLPARCQTWFKHADAFFLCDSDSDRRARVLRRTLIR